MYVKQFLKDNGIDLSEYDIDQSGRRPRRSIERVSGITITHGNTLKVFPCVILEYIIAGINIRGN